MALKAFQKAAPEVAVMFWSAEDGAGPLSVTAVVPDAIGAKLDAGAWLNDALAAVGGKGGGKKGSAMGSAKESADMNKAIELARSFASRSLQ